MYEPIAGFRSQKAAQASAFFAVQESPIEKLKLIKLLYLSERHSIAEFGEPIFYDEFFSLKHGPICSSALNAINGEFDVELWRTYVLLENDRKTVRAIEKFDRNALDYLSDADWEILSGVWVTFGFMSASQIRNWTHKNCPEYAEVAHGRMPISYRDILKALGEEDIDEIDDRIRKVRLSLNLLSA